MALCQFLPGPASSQVGIGIGLAKAGLPGALAAWLGFTMPSALALLAFGYGVAAFQHVIPGGILHGLKVVAVAVERRHRSEEHTSELQSLMRISYAVFCLKKQKTIKTNKK